MKQSFTGEGLEVGGGLTRRSFQRALAGLALASPALGHTQVDRPAASARTGLVYVGTDGHGLRAMRFDADAGHMAMLGVVADLPRPRWVLPHPHLPMVYVAVDGPGQEGRVLACAVDHSSAALTPISEVAAGGAGTTHLALDVSSATLFAANFGGGSASSVAVLPDGRLGARVSTVQATGSGPHRRQASPHAHGVSVDPSGRFVLVPDLGADRVFVHGFDRRTQTLTPEDVATPRAWVAPAGSGPRRAVFGGDGQFVYVLCELTAELHCLRWDRRYGRLTSVRSWAISSPGFQGVKSASELVLSRDGRFLYVADRGEGALLVYGVLPDTGELVPVQRLHSGGEAPWAFDMHPSGRWLLVAHQRSDRLNLFAIDAVSGHLTDSGQAIGSPGPVSVCFVF